MKKIIALVIITCMACLCYSQDTEKLNTKENKERFLYHYVGLQSNLLLRQLFSLGAAASSQNPYLIAYNLRFGNSGIEFISGFGNVYSKTINEDNFKTEVNNLNLRFGVSRKTMVSKKFEVGYGLDFLYNSNSSDSESKSVITFGGFPQTSVDSTYNYSQTTSTGIGFGPQVNLAFYITDNIKLGTEATYYFFPKEETKFESTSKRFLYQGNQIISFEETKVKEKSSVSKTQFSIPLAIFLFVRF